MSTSFPVKDSLATTISGSSVKVLPAIKYLILIEAPSSADRGKDTLRLCTNGLTDPAEEVEGVA